MSSSLNIPEDVVSNTVVRATYKDTDQMGVVYYANYFIWFEIGRGEFMRRCGVSYKDFEKEGIMLPVTHASCDYIKHVSYDEMVRIEVSIHELTRASISFLHNIYSYPGGDLLASGRTKHVFLGKSGKIQRCGEKFLKIFEQALRERTAICSEPLSNVEIMH
jgi:acyl-CoA thioester hydrolase